MTRARVTITIATGVPVAYTSQLTTALKGVIALAHMVAEKGGQDGK